MHLRHVGLYFGLVTLLTLPFWLAGARISLDLAPGLPLAALAIVCPATAALALATATGGVTGARALMERTLDFRGAGWRMVLVLLINPVLFGLSFLVARMSGADIPSPGFSASSLWLLVMFLPAALLEEVGWTAYALDRLQRGMRLVWAGLIIGAYWAAWHLPALVQAGRSSEWIAWWIVWTLAARLVMVWAYAATGRSVVPVVIYHALSNVCWQLYPVSGSHFDPKLTGLLTVGLALILAPALIGKAVPASPSKNPEPASPGTP